MMRHCAGGMAGVLWAAVASATVIIDWVPVGNAGNGPDPQGRGAVAYEYRIGQYEVTNGQYLEFLNAKAAVGDPLGLYSNNMAGSYGGITRTGDGTAGSPWVYALKNAGWANRPVNFVTFWDAARFANWLHNGQGSGDTESGAYRNLGLATFAREVDAQFYLPTQDEWFKAAYHKNDGLTPNYWDYPTGSNVAPSNDLLTPDPGNSANVDNADFPVDPPYYSTIVGEFENSASPYGTFDQGGNVIEWTETLGTPGTRLVRGGGWMSSVGDLIATAMNQFTATNDLNQLGFRLAAPPAPAAEAPEPGSLAILLAGLAGPLVIWRRRRARPRLPA